MKKTWNEKLLAGKPHVVKCLDKNFAGMKAGQKMLVPSAKLLDDFIQKIPTGHHMNIVTMRETLAQDFQAEVTCPVATGFAIKIVVEAAFEKLNQGKNFLEVTPVWRVLDKDSPTLGKVSFEPKILLQQREAEGLV